MFLVRVVIQVKWGKMDEVLAGLSELRALRDAPGVHSLRVMTDVSGPTFTLVQEIEVDSLAQFEQQLQAQASDPRGHPLSARMPDAFESGHREYYQIHEL